MQISGDEMGEVRGSHTSQVLQIAVKTLVFIVNEKFTGDFSREKGYDVTQTYHAGYQVKTRVKWGSEQKSRVILKDYPNNSGARPEWLKRT